MADSPSRSSLTARDPRSLREDAPLLDAWLAVTDAADAGAVHPFSIPGHKQRTGLAGDVVRHDVPLYAGCAPVKQADALLARAEAKAAQAWGCDWARLSVGGSTHANQAAALAVGRPGDEVVVSRTLHRSLLLGLVLAGLRPVWIRPDIDVRTGLPTAVPVSAVEAALAARPGARAVFLGDPSYVGTLSDLDGHASAAHAAGVPLVVDAAWAAHFGFSPALPPHALARGADALVTSTHKMLPAANQGALLLARTRRSGGLLDPDRLQRAFDATHTTSPSGTILASTDAARALLVRDGPALGRRLVGLVGAARERLRAVPGLDVLEGPDVDPAKLVVLLAGSGAHGHAVEADLLTAGIRLEMADRDLLVPVVTFADDERSVDRLVAAVASSVVRRSGPPRTTAASAAWAVDAVTALDPREAFFAAHVVVDAARAVGRISAELVAPYPPGVPVLAPGEVVTAEALAALRAVRDDGGRIAYAADPTLETLQVVAPD
jgi:lysine decarboxylase